MNTTDHARLTGRLKIEGVPARTAKHQATRSIADQKKLATARKQTARAIARRKAKERLPDPVTIDSFDCSQADPVEIERLCKLWGLGK